MAPIRRYLRITKHSVLEVRIYLENPAHSESWLLHRSDPALPRIIEAIRPLVLPKLREENERARGYKKKKRGIKDVVSGDDFEVSIYLTEPSVRHSLLTKHKRFEDKPPIKSNSNKLTKWLNPGTSDKPHEIVDDDADPVVIPDEEEETINLADVPEAPAEKPKHSGNRRSGRVRSSQAARSLFVNESDSDEDFFQTQRAPSGLRGSANTNAEQDKPALGDGDGDENMDDKKKLSMNTEYDGFSIYGRILCLVVKHKGVRATGLPGSAQASSQKMLENWVSTQANQEQDLDEEDEG